MLSDLKELLGGFPGDCDVVIELRTSVGPRNLRLGPEFRVTRDAGLHAELEALLGSSIWVTRRDGALEPVAQAAGGAAA